MIVFGSVRHGHFVCDTVFVVSSAIQHARATWRDVLDGRVPEDFVVATVEPMYVWRQPEDQIFTLYEGAIDLEPIDGMFSFVPCLPLNDPAVGFARPIVDPHPGVSPTNARAVRFNSEIPASDVPALWRAVAERVLAAGLALGTRIDIDT